MNIRLITFGDPESEAKRHRRNFLARIRWWRRRDKALARGRERYKEVREQKIAKARQWQANNREKDRARQRAYYWSHPEFRERQIRKASERQRAEKARV